MADDRPTPDQSAAEKIGRAIDGQIVRLQDERAVLLNAGERLAEIDAELAVLTTERERIEPRRPRKPREPGIDVKNDPSTNPRETP